VGLETRQQVFLQSCRLVASNSVHDINACAVKRSLPDGSLQGEEEHQHVGPQRMASIPVQILQGRRTPPKLQYKEEYVKRQQSCPSRGIDINLWKLRDRNSRDATGVMKDGEDRPRSTKGMSETPCSLISTTSLGALGSTLETCVAKVVETPERGSTRHKEVDDSDAMSVSTRSCTDNGEASTVKQCSAPSVIDRQEDQCARVLFFDLAADDLDEDEANFFPTIRGA